MRECQFFENKGLFEIMALYLPAQKDQLCPKVSIQSVDSGQGKALNTDQSANADEYSVIACEFSLSVYGNIQITVKNVCCSMDKYRTLKIGYSSER